MKKPKVPQPPRVMPAVKGKKDAVASEKPTTQQQAGMRHVANTVKSKAAQQASVAVSDSKQMLGRINLGKPDSKQNLPDASEKDARLVRKPDDLCKLFGNYIKRYQSKLAEGCLKNICGFYKEQIRRYEKKRDQHC